MSWNIGHMRHPGNICFAYYVSREFPLASTRFRLSVRLPALVGVCGSFVLHGALLQPSQVIYN